MTIIASCDPGLSGAICALRVGTAGVEFLSLIDTPVMPDNSKRQINVDSLCRWIEKWNPDEAVIENVRPMGGSGAKAIVMSGASAFRFGMAIGQVRAVFQCYRIPVRLVDPRSWKAAFGIKGKAKEEARQIAIERLPAAAPHLSRKLDHNRAESVLIGLYQAERRGFL